MSTKTTLSINSFVHVYEDLFSENNTSLSFRFSDSRIDNVTINLDIESAAVIYAGLNIKMKEIMSIYSENDSSINSRVSSIVSKRISKKGIHAIFGSEIYGSSEDSEESQIERGVSHFMKKREDVIKIIDKVISSLDDKRSSEAIMSLTENASRNEEEIVLKKLTDLIVISMEKGIINFDSSVDTNISNGIESIMEDIACKSASMEKVEKSIDKITSTITGEKDQTPSLFE